MAHEDINEYLEEVERKTLHRGVIRAINKLREGKAVIKDCKKAFSKDKVSL